ncbi:hypothetical protein U9M48_012763 [Paspalum notatum var. saurae]|uniref:Uncharacterized protein n=1 Tax=Paspalum notatum var. saurae TaxID=547442 RepID=A0AAQ3SY66_PASNO
MPLRHPARPPLPLWPPRASACWVAGRPFPTASGRLALPHLPARHPLPAAPAPAADGKKKDGGLPDLVSARLRPSGDQIRLGGALQERVGKHGVVGGDERGRWDLLPAMRAGRFGAMRLAGQAAPPPQALDRRGTIRPPPPVDASPGLQSMACRTNITMQNSACRSSTDSRSGGARSRLSSSDFNSPVVPVDGVELAEQEQRLCLVAFICPSSLHLCTYF